MLRLGVGKLISYGKSMAIDIDSTETRIPRLVWLRHAGLLSAPLIMALRLLRHGPPRIVGYCHKPRILLDTASYPRMNWNMIEFGNIDMNHFVF